MTTSCHVAATVWVPLCEPGRMRARGWWGRWAAVVVAGIVGMGGEARGEAPEVPLSPAGGASAAPRRRELVVEIPGERSTPNRIALAAVAGAAVISGAVGLGFHLDARSARDQVERDTFRGAAWTQERVNLVARADRSSAWAVGMYAAGGALLLGAAIAYIATDPAGTRSVIRIGGAAPTLAPVAGGAVLGGGWAF